MLAHLKAHFLHVLAIVYASALPYLNAKFGLSMTDNYQHGIQGLCAILLLALWHKGIIQAKIESVLTEAAKAAAKAVLLATIGLGLLGCSSLQPQVAANLQTAFTGIDAEYLQAVDAGLIKSVNGVALTPSEQSERHVRVQLIQKILADAQGSTPVPAPAPSK